MFYKYSVPTKFKKNPDKFLAFAAKVYENSTAQFKKDLEGKIAFDKYKWVTIEIEEHIDINVDMFLRKNGFILRHSGCSGD